MQNIIKLSQPSVSRIIHEITDILQHAMDKYIVFPMSTAERNVIENE